MERSLIPITEKTNIVRSLMLEGKILDCSWKEFEELIKEEIGSDFLWTFRLRGTQSNRRAVMESIERMVAKNNGSSPDGGNIFIEPEKSKAGGTLPPR